MLTHISYVGPVLNVEVFADTGAFYSCALE